MESKEKNTKEKILEEALKLFAQSGYMGTSMNDIASKLGVTKAALYKHYKSKQEILDSIIEKMNEFLFSGMLGDAGKARQTALDFYGPIFLLYSIYDGAEDKSHVIKLLEEHMDHFLQEMQTS